MRTMIMTTDMEPVIIESTSRVSGPATRGSHHVGRGQSFGTSYVYVSTDLGSTWVRSDVRSTRQLAETLKRLSLKELKELGY